jgi:hypothetical protein
LPDHPYGHPAYAKFPYIELPPLPGPGGTYFFTVNLLERRQDTLVRHIDSHVGLDAHGTLTKRPLTFGRVVTQRSVVKLPPNVGLYPLGHKRRTVNLAETLA